ncbi:hypothetical protein H6776_00245 [Candidatus Nomurabacteria bacterium]|nr:hypothetical protein [Candidatus Nomurabacteria bacterium]
MEPINPLDEQINITDVINDLVDVLDIEDMPEEDQEELIAMMGETVIQNALARFMDSQEESVVADLNAKLDSMSLPEFLAFLDETYPDFGYLMNDEMRLFLEQLDEME